MWMVSTYVHVMSKKQQKLNMCCNGVSPIQNLQQRDAVCAYLNRLVLSWCCQTEGVVLIPVNHRAIECEKAAVRLLRSRGC